MHNPLYRVGRRGFLQASAAGVVAAGLPALSPTVFAYPGAGRAKSVVFVLMSGGLSQLDSLDPKPQAALEIRGEFSSISTAIPGVAFSQHLPLLAEQANRWSIVRSMSHTEHNHLLATHVALTGRPTPVPRGASDLDRVQSRTDFPNMAAAVDYLRPSSNGVPTGVSLPNYYIEGPLTWPGQYSGFLGPKHDPWQISQDPNDPSFKVDALSLQAGVTPQRLQSRRELLDQVNAPLPLGADRSKAFTDQQGVAFSLLTSAKVTTSFQLDRETPETRDRYGRNKFGQSLLLARRLVEVGVPVIQATMGIVQTWDTHVDNWGKLKNALLPQVDRGLAALMDDLSASGLLDQTLVIVMSEFGRTPKVSNLPGEALPGRDHWASVYSLLAAGAGVRGGQVIGQSDSIAAYPVSRAWSPADLCTTVYNALGIGEEVHLQDPLGRPNALRNGAVIEPLYSGREA
ncbi:MAG: hypothetical protein JWP89_4517 [Schlesneria sp.]|nr:hypothetical protein [Schlesneria sp.]